MGTLDYARSDGRAGLLPSPAVLAVVSCFAGVVGNAWAVYAAASLRHAPPGVTIRPMGLSVMLMLISLGTFAIGLPSGLCAMIFGWRRLRVMFAGAVGAALSLTPIYVSAWVVDWVVARYGLILGD